MKKLISILAVILVVLPTFLLCVSAEDEVLYFSVNGVNCTRLTDYMVIFTGSETTGSNPWGYECRVSAEGKVLSIGGNDQQIPKGGFVISGHGSSADWLKEHVKVGMNARFFSENLVLAISEGAIDPFYTFYVPLNGINVYRSADFLVAYDDTYGSTTKTNEYGYEIVINADGTVKSMGGNNNAIPKGGFVISAHGDAIDTLLEKGNTGLIIELDKKNTRLVCHFGEKSLAPAIEKKIAEADALVEKRLSEYAVFGGDPAAILNKVKSDFASAKELFKAKGDYSALTKLYDSMDTMLSDVRLSAAESNPCEYRGVWLRPKETNRQAVAATVQKLYDLGINSIHIETQYSGYTCFKTYEGCYMSLNPIFGRFDVLQAFIEECHKRGMELHCWYPNFYVGSVNSCPTYNKRPDLFMKNNLGHYYEEGEGEFMFLDPSNEEATEFLLTLYRYLLENYDIDGYELDYIRYPSYDGKQDWGYFSNASKKFKEKHGFEPTYDTKASWWADWCAIRGSYVTNFVKQMRDLIDEVAPNVILAADVSPSAIYGVNNSICQDAKSWLDNGWIDLVHPMAYSLDGPSKYAPLYATENENCFTTIGLGAFESFITPEVLYEQIGDMRYTGAIGSVTFESTAYIAKAEKEYIKDGVYKDYAPAPAINTVSSLLGGIEFIGSRLNVMQSRGAITASDKEKFRGLLDDACSTVAEGGAKALEKAIKPFETAISGVKADARKILQNDIDNLRRIAKLSKQNYNEIDFKNGYLFLRTNTSAEDLALNFSWAAEFTVADGAFATGKSVTLATENAIKLEQVVIGDVTGDGKIDSKDYMLLKRHVLGSFKLEGSKLAAADVNGDKLAKSNDYMLVKRHVLGTFDINA